MFRPESRRLRHHSRRSVASRSHGNDGYEWVRPCHRTPVAGPCPLASATLSSGRFRAVVVLLLQR